MRILALLSAVVVPLVLVVGCAGNDSSAGPNVKVVQMTGLLKFDPPVLTVTAGQTVIWKNTAIMVHTVTCDPSLARRDGDASLPSGAAPFNSGDVAPGAQYAYTFATPGTYKYFCIPHESMGMVGKVVVKPVQ